MKALLFALALTFGTFGFALTTGGDGGGGGGSTNPQGEILDFA